MTNKSEGTLPSSLLYLLAASSTEESLLSSPATDDGLLLGDGDEGAPSTTPSVEQKMFLVISVALATVCFFTNAVQIGVFVRGGMVRTVKSLLLLSQACSGLVAAGVVAFPIHVISARGGTGVTEDGFNACYLGHSGVILLALLTSISTATLLLLDHHLHRHHHAKYVVSGGSLQAWGVGLVVVWLWAGMVSLLPWLGWNTWLAHDAKCHLSTLWPLSFSAFVTFLTAVHVVLALLMWANGRAAAVLAWQTHQRLRAQGQIIHEDTLPVSGSTEGYVRVACWLISLSSVVPILGHVVFASSCAASTQCMQSARHYHEDAASLPWASFLLVSAAVANPLLYVFSDDQVSSATLQLLTRLCCFKGRGRQTPSVRGPAQTTAECGTGSFVTTSDTRHLVADTT